MKKNLTELVFILDRSGSMSGLEDDVIGGFNAMIEKQKKVPGEAIVTTVLFDDKYQLLHDRISLKGIAPLTDKDYYVRGCTALLDSIGRTIAKESNTIKHTIPEERPENVLVVINTDGYENSSREYTWKQIQTMIRKMRTKYNWEFIFLGANIDSAQMADELGIDRNNAVDYHADEEGVASNFNSVSMAATSYRINKCVEPSWADETRKDYKARCSKK